MSLRTILFVDDDPDIRRVGQLSLERVGGLEVHLAPDGASALEVLRAGLEVDLVLLDVMMPGMQGPEVLAALQRVAGRDAPPVVFLTAKAQQSELEGYLALGALGVISKPFDPMGLSAQLRALFEARPR